MTDPKGVSREEMSSRETACLDSGATIVHECCRCGFRHNLTVHSEPGKVYLHFALIENSGPGEGTERDEAESARTQPGSTPGPEPPGPSMSVEEALDFIESRLTTHEGISESIMRQQALATLREATKPSAKPNYAEGVKVVSRGWLMEAVVEIYGTHRDHMWRTLGRLLRELGIVVEGEK